MAEVMQHRGRRPTMPGRQGDITRTFEDLQSSFMRAGARRAALSNLKVMGQPEATAPPPPALAQLDGKQSRRQRRHSPRQVGGKGCFYEPSASDGKSRSPEPDTDTGTSSTASSASSVWVWPTGRHAPTRPKQDEASILGVPTDGTDGAAAKKAFVAERKNMFADVASSSSASTVHLTASESGSKTNSPTSCITADDPFWNNVGSRIVSELSMRFPEPPTRVPTSAASTSSTLTISGWGKNIASTLPPVHLLLPPRWRKRLRAAGANKRCRKSSSRWIARSKATSSMSETCVLARAVSISDGTSHRNRHRREREKEAAVTAALVAAVSHESAPAAVSHEPAPALRLAEAAAGEEKPSQVAEVSEESPPQLVELGEDKKVGEREQQQQQHQQQEHSAVPPALPTPVADQAPSSSPPAAPLFTAPRPPLSSSQRQQQQQQQQQRQQTPLAPQNPLRRTARFFGSVSVSISQGGSAKENRLTPSPPTYMVASRMTMKNRLASSGSSIFEEDGDDSKKTEWLNPYTLSPPAPAAPAAPATGAASFSPHTSPPAPDASATAVRAPEADKGAGAALSSLSPAWVWEGGEISPRASTAAAAAAAQQQGMFITGAGWGGRKGDAAVRPLSNENNRRDAARIYGDQRRGVESGETGIWRSARRPTPLNADLFDDCW